MSWVAIAINTGFAHLGLPQERKTYRHDVSYEGLLNSGEKKPKDIRGGEHPKRPEPRRAEHSSTPSQAYNPLDISTPEGMLFYQHNLFNSGMYDTPIRHESSPDHSGSSHSSHHGSSYDSSSSHSSHSHDSGSSYDSGSSSSFDSGSSW